MNQKHSRSRVCSLRDLDTQLNCPSCCFFMCQMGRSPLYHKGARGFPVGGKGLTHTLCTTDGTVTSTATITRALRVRMKSSVPRSRGLVS